MSVPTILSTRLASSSNPATGAPFISMPARSPSAPAAIRTRIGGTCCSSGAAAAATPSGIRTSKSPSASTIFSDMMKNASSWKTMSIIGVMLMSIFSESFESRFAIARTLLVTPAHFGSSYRARSANFSNPFSWQILMMSCTSPVLAPESARTITVASAGSLPASRIADFSRSR